MICPHCGAEIPDSSRFCLECGQPIAQSDAAVSPDNHRETPRNQSTDGIPTNNSEATGENFPEIPDNNLGDEFRSNPREVDAPMVDSANSTEQHVSPSAEDGIESQIQRQETAEPTTQKLPMPASDTETHSPEEQATNPKPKHPTWLLVVLCIVVPPVGIILLWLWGRNRNKLLNALITVGLCLLTAFYVICIQATVEAVHEVNETNYQIEALSNLDATYESDGVRLKYPSSWTNRNISIDAIFPSTDAYIGFVFLTPEDMGQDASQYNLMYQDGFDRFTDSIINAFNNTDGCSAGNSTDGTQVLSNAMYREFPLALNDSSGTLVVYADADGNTYGIYVYVGNEIGDYKSQAETIIDKVVESVEFTANNYDHDPKQNPITSISAAYSGDTSEGTVLDESNNGISVTATYAGGATGSLSNSQWSISNPQTLEAGQTSTVTIKVGNVTTDLSVECTTMTEQQFKDSCEEVSYDDLLRNPDTYSGHNIHLRGKVFQSVNGTILANVTQGNYGIWDDVTMIYWSGEPNVIEDDVISIWGAYGGTYTYTTAIGSQKTVPLIYARYMTIE